MEVVILAAGKGTRMYSEQPKVLHEIGGKALLAHVLAAADKLQPDRIHVVVGFGAEQVQAHFAHRSGINWVTQAEQLGTGHAVQQAVPGMALNSDSKVLILYGDVPLVRIDTLKELLQAGSNDELSLLTVTATDPDGMGRIVRDDEGAVRAIVEHRDADAEQRLINEINTGIMALPAAHLAGWLDQLGNDNNQQEYYLTDVVAMAVKQGLRVEAVQAGDEREVMGVNDKYQLAFLERYYQSRQINELLRAGVTIRDPARLDIRGELQVGRDVEIDVSVIFKGKVRLGDRVRIGANSIIRDSVIGSDSVILPASNIDGSEIGEWASIGPNARLRPGTVLADQVKIGNFVETKQARIGNGSKANHLAYIGDAEIGSGCNIGAGTIFCNYDGANKHKTVLGDNVFVGSNSVLVAPVSLADNSFVAAGSAVNSDVPADNLAIARSKQRNIAGWKRPSKHDRQA